MADKEFKMYSVEVLIGKHIIAVSEVKAISKEQAEQFVQAKIKLSVKTL